MPTDPRADFDVVPIPMTTDPEAVAAAMQRRPDVEYAQARYRNYAMARPNDTLYANQWNFPAIDMERAWDIQPGATSNIIVAVLDSGMAYRTGTLRYNSRFPFRVTPNGPLYPALGVVDVPFAAAPELGTNGSERFVAPRDFIWNDDLPVDLDGHGTHVAGTIGQLTNNSSGTAGMAYNVRLMPVKIIQGLWDEIFSSPFDGTDDVVARGIRYAADNGAKVLNLSIGRTQGGPAPVVTDALRYAVSRGCFIVRGLGQHARYRQPAQSPGAAGARDRRHGGSGRRRPYARPRLLLDDGIVCGDCRAGRRSARRAVRAPASCSSHSTSICSRPTSGRSRSSDRRAPMRLRTTTSKARRWRTTRLGICGAADAAGHHEPRGDRGGDETIRDRQGRAGKRRSISAIGLINPRATLRGLGLAR